MRVLKWLGLAGLAAVAALAVAHFAFPEPLVRAGIRAERAYAGLAEASIEAAGTRIAYLEGGAGEPLVLLHGIGADKDTWVRAARDLTPHYRVLVPDLPGFGDSGRPPGWSYAVDAQVGRLRELFAAWGLERPHLGGNSMGGFIAAAYAARHAETVASLWLVAPAGVASAQPSEMMERIARGEPVVLLPQSVADFEFLFSFVFHDPPFAPPVYRRVLAQRAVADHALHSRIFSEVRNEPAWLEARVGGLATPTRIVWGERDRVLHVSGAAVLAGLMPNASVFRMPDVGHLPMAEQPAAVARDYLDFRASLK